ncbi:hypothetical protein HK104_001576 [Borealophlyctis nickersoniae]|nr:hypothetical protein HK104_001576 [Borealophlyctis nickersoniae]
MVKCLLFGASRGCGLESALQLVKNGHEVTLMVRRAQEMEENERIKALEPEAKARVHLVQGDAFNKEDVKRVFDLFSGDLGLILFSLGGRPSFQNPFAPKLVPPAICSRTISIFLPALRDYIQAHPTSPQPRFILISSNGLGKIGHSELPMALKPLYGWLLKEPHADKEVMEYLVFRAAGKAHPDPYIEKFGAEHAPDVQVVDPAG